MAERTSRLGWPVYRSMLRARLRSEMQYRASFVSMLFSQATVTALDVLQIVLLFRAVPSLGGWSQGQVLFLAGASTFCFGLADLFASPVELLSNHVRVGTLDRFLIRPVPVLTQLLADEFALRRAGRCLQSSILLVALLVHGSLDDGSGSWALRLLLFVWMIIGATLTYSALFIFTNCLSFWAPDSRETANAFTYGGALASQYPVHALDRWLRRALLTAVPLGLVIYVPSIAIVGGPNPLAIPLWLQWAGPLAFVPMIGLAGATWRTGLRHYESAGS